MSNIKFHPTVQQHKLFQTFGNSDILEVLYIYLHIKADTGEPFYVGKGKGGRAYSKHHRNNWWNHTVNKYGYDVIILENNLTEEEAFNREIYWIKRIGRKDLKQGPLVNLTDGGEGTLGNRRYGEANHFFGKTHTNNTKEHLSNKTKEWHKTNTNPFKGHKHSKESLDKLSESLKGKFSGDKNPAAKKVLHIESGKIFTTLNEAAAFANVTRPTMRSWCKKGDKFRYE